jgi:hypothetical protein
MKVRWKWCTCGEQADYDERYDAAYCDKCDLWLELMCGFKSPIDCCYECDSRPSKPSEVKP